MVMASRASFFIRRCPGAWARASVCSCRGSAVPATFIFLCLVLAGVSMFRLARAWLSPAGTIAATVLYVASPYQLVLALLSEAILPNCWLPRSSRSRIHYAIRCGGSRRRGLRRRKDCRGRERAIAECRSSGHCLRRDLACERAGSRRGQLRFGILTGPLLDPSPIVAAPFHWPGGTGVGIDAGRRLHCPGGVRAGLGEHRSSRFGWLSSSRELSIHLDSRPRTQSG